MLGAILVKSSVRRPARGSTGARGTGGYSLGCRHRWVLPSAGSRAVIEGGGGVADGVRWIFRYFLSGGVMTGKRGYLWAHLSSDCRARSLINRRVTQNILHTLFVLDSAHPCLWSPRVRYGTENVVFW